MNPEKIVADHLRSDAGARVVAHTPENTADSWVRLTMLDAAQTQPRPDHLIACLFQCDCYAGKDGGQPEAMALSWAVRASLLSLVGAALTVTVTETKIIGHARLPDQDFTPERERVEVSARVWMHS